MAKTYIFDAVHTILRPVPDVITAYFLAGKRRGSLLEKETVKKRFRIGRQRHFATNISAVKTKPGALPSSDDIEFQLWKELVAFVFEDVDPIDGLFEELWEHFASPKNWQIYEDVVPCFESIKASGDKIVIASNFDTRLYEVLNQQPACSVIDNVFCSAEVGYRKPDPLFYKEISDTLGLDVEDSVVMTGDDFENDFVAPRKHGWQAVYLDRRQKEKRAENEIGELCSVLNCS